MALTQIPTRHPAPALVIRRPRPLPDVGDRLDERLHKQESEQHLAK